MMSPWAEALFVKYGPIVTGLVIGTGAKYGLALSGGRRITCACWLSMRSCSAWSP
jgi:hypothetical protein